ncbi:MAG: (2Fe-2S)-binding protein [Armatimonadota bacterium]|nr:(2Fe-2S)-binding protein [Armatimonadota bacterium]MDR7439449.1 (2Fe-2S)-binding protein [Armatimonadota bacterium]MDR7562908.1 (2Fe-2S)-binding protein [Armatimonadota bacterium]MDR7568400.1 (2Fe-2S)-binding protein [Armatimonadota bacterium]MDR7601454.1 (2Fe-2S)-binding protein [Armatimonadota bacterium]
MDQPVRLRVNGHEYRLLVPVHRTLLEVLREDLGLVGTKHGCELGECGVCTVLVDGRPMLSCLLLAVDAEGHEVTTIEGLSPVGELHPLQRAFAEIGALQCGYCTPAMILTAKALLEEVPAPTEEQIRDALSGVFCRCTGYLKIIEAVQAASRQLSAGAAASELR